MKKLVNILLGLTLSGFAIPALAVDLMDIYAQAEQNDPTYQAAKSTRLSNREALPQSIANLLPNISATANTTRNSVDVLSSSESGMPTGNSTFNSNGYTVNLTQPLFNFGNWMQVSAANATAKQADATLVAAWQDLITRVAKAYFDVLYAQDNLHFVHAEKLANARQLEQIKERFKVGLETITSVYDAQASYDAVVASEIAAESTLHNDQEALRQLTGQPYFPIDSFKHELPLITPAPADVDQWVVAAEQHNMNLQAASFAAQAARQKIKINYAGHFPTLNAVGNYTRNNTQQSDSANTNSKAIGLQLNVPLFQGGLVLSQTRQAQDDYATASAKREDAYRQAVITTRQKYNDVLADISKIKADRQAIISAQSSFDSTQEAYKVGTRTIVDVLTAQQNLYQAQSMAAQDSYTYLNDTLLLKQAAGNLEAADLKNINDWLHISASVNAKQKKT